MTSDKDQIRQHAKKFRDQLAVQPEWADEAADNFLNALHPTTDTIISVYYPIGSELDTSPLVEKLWSKNMTVCLPIINGDVRELTFARWDKNTQLTKKSFGIYEPADTAEKRTPDILVVPLLAFDQRGNRMGYGRGHYDETLRVLRANKPILAVGYAYAEQAVLLALPTEPHDQKLDMVITPQRVFDFR